MNAEEIQAAAARIAKARMRVNQLSSGPRRWTMTIPVRKDDDDDCVFADALDDGAHALSALEACQRERDRYRAALANIVFGDEVTAPGLLRIARTALSGAQEPGKAT